MAVLCSAVAALGLWANVGGAWQTTAGVADWVTDRFQDDPPRLDAAGRYGASIPKVFAWTRPPTVYEASVETMRRDYARYDPNRSRAFSPRLATTTRLPIPGLVQVSAATAGVPFTTEGEVTFAQVVDPGSSPDPSWAIQLQDPAAPGHLVVCRLGAPRTGPPVRLGDTALAHGVLLAEGTMEGLGDAGMAHVLYMACSAVTRVERLSLALVGKRQSKETPSR